MDEKITIEVRKIDLDKILVGLSKLPYEYVFKLIEDLQQQAKDK